jgi:AraC family transcriptional regulator
LKQVFQFGKFYGATRHNIETSAFDFAEVEDFVNGTVPVHTHENAHFLFVARGEYEGRIQDRKRFCAASSMLYYPAGTTHADHFRSAGGKFLTISLNSEINRELLGELDFFNCSLVFNDGEISWLGQRMYREVQAPDSLSPLVLEGMANELLVYAVRSLNKSEKPPAWLNTAQELISDCCDESISIAEIALQVGVHPLHLPARFDGFSTARRASIYANAGSKKPRTCFWDRKKRSSKSRSSADSPIRVSLPELSNRTPA